jgi:hypothetical protein
MKKMRFALLGLLFVLASTALPAQFLIGPSIAGGLTYSKNFLTPDTSQYYISNAPSIYANGGLDLLYQFDDNIRVQVGLGYTYKRFNLQAPEDRTGLSFTNITRNATAISVPMTLHYRIPITEDKTYFNVIVGHSLDFTREDSSLIKSSTTAIDSGGTWTLHEYNNIKRINPTVLLGLGADLKFENGNILNISGVWGIGTGRIFDGKIQEWNVLNQDYDPADPNRPVPEEFPEHFFEWALRGSSVSIRASYWFDLSKKEEKADAAPGATESSEESKGVKEKKEKAPKEEKVPKEKKIKSTEPDGL